jgi:hypothetical protein
LVGTTADFWRFGPRRSLPFNDLPDENSGTAGRIGEVGLAALLNPTQPSMPGAFAARKPSAFANQQGNFTYSQVRL